VSGVGVSGAVTVKVSRVRYAVFNCQWWWFEQRPNRDITQNKWIVVLAYVTLSLHLMHVIYPF